MLRCIPAPRDVLQIGRPRIHFQANGGNRYPAFTDERWDYLWCRAVAAVAFALPECAHRQGMVPIPT